MTKLTTLMKEKGELQTALIEALQKIEKLRETIGNLQQLNAKVSKQKKDLQEYSMKVEDEIKKLKADLLKANQNLGKI